jgi:hypothetical protein
MFPLCSYGNIEGKEGTMQVDRNLLRQILEQVEQAPQPEVQRVTEPPRCPPDVCTWHMQLLIDGGYVTAKQLRPCRPAFAVGLTLAGQRLLDELRDRGGIARSAGAIAAKIVASTAAGLLIAKARAAGVVL